MLIHTSHLTKRFVMGDTVVNALQDVSVDIDQGEFVAIMGPSGSGKSTFMNMIGCLDKPTSGNYEIAGQDVGNLSHKALAVIRNQNIGFVFQQFNLLARSTALENVMLPLLYSAVPHREHRMRAEQRLTQVGLGERFDHKPAQLSGGQQQRVAIARALVNEPALLLADEPTGALDSRTSLEVMALFQRLHAMGQTVIIVTHEPDVAEFASRMIYFKDGRIVQDNTHVPKDAASALAQLGGGA